MPSPKEIEETNKRNLGLSTEQQAEVLRAGLLQFNQRLPMPSVNQELHRGIAPTTELKKTEVTLPMSPLGFPPPVPAGESAKSGGGSATDTVSIFIIEDGAPVSYDFQATLTP